MTVDDWWGRIEEFTRTGDRVGLLVAADAMEELAEDDLAHAIRYAVKYECVPIHHFEYRNWGVFIRYATPDNVWHVCAIYMADTVPFPTVWDWFVHQWRRYVQQAG